MRASPKSAAAISCNVDGLIGCKISGLIGSKRSVQQGMVERRQRQISRVCIRAQLNLARLRPIRSNELRAFKEIARRLNLDSEDREVVFEFGAVFV